MGSNPNLGVTDSCPCVAKIILYCTDPDRLLTVVLKKLLTPFHRIRAAADQVFVVVRTLVSEQFHFNTCIVDFE